MPAGRRVALWCVGTTALWLSFLTFAARNLDDFRPVSNDEVWILSASHKLATEGVLGSDLFAGVFDGERHYYFNLPAHHYVQALVIRVWGGGIAQARAPSLAAATALIWITGWLAFRWYGLAAAWLTTALLVVWRADLVGLYPGLPLLGVARSARYDLAAEAWMWIALGGLDRLVTHPRRLTATVVGIAAGAATLTQFFGAFVVPLAAVALAVFRLDGRRRASLALWVSLGFALVVLPYVVDVARHPAQWVGQNITIRSPDRMRIDSAGFYLDNLWREPQRFAHMVGTPGSLVLTVGIWPALAWLAVRTRAREASGDRLLLASVVVFASGLALVDATKAALYAVVLWPSLCIVCAGGAVAGLRWGTRPERRPLARAATIAIAAVLLGVVLVDGLRAYRIDAHESRNASRYEDVGARMAAHLPGRTVIVGPSRWYWPLRTHRYYAWNGLWWRWQVARDENRSAPSLQQFVDATGARYVIVTDALRTDLGRFPEPLQQQFQAFLAEACVRVEAWDDPTYGRIELFAIVAQ